MCTFAASRVAMRKQRMKEQGCRRVILKTSGDLIYMCTHSCLCSFGLLKMAINERKTSERRRAWWQQEDRRDWFMAWWLLGWSSEIPRGAQGNSRRGSCRGVEVVQPLCLKSSLPTGAQTLPQAGLPLRGSCRSVSQPGSCRTASPPFLSVLSVSSLCSNVV